MQVPSISQKMCTINNCVPMAPKMPFDAEVGCPLAETAGDDLKLLKVGTAGLAACRAKFKDQN